MKRMKEQQSHRLAQVFVFLLIQFLGSNAFSFSTIFHPQLQQISKERKTCLFAKAKKKKGGGKGGSAAGIKGFGSALASSGSKKGEAAINPDRSKDARQFYDFMEKNGGGDNLKRTALAFFPLGNGDSLRGVVALRDFKKGDILIRIPYEMAINLGVEGEDPTLPALNLLREYCASMGTNDLAQHATSVDRNPYFKMLPEYQGSDCLGSTDFFPSEAMDALQSPYVVDETRKRGDRIQKRFQQDFREDEEDIQWLDGTPLTAEHLKWAVWLITSRVLTVQGDAEEGRSYRLLIPYLDMCNHDRKSPHVLTGRAVPGGELKVVAGSPVKTGEQINICYGGGVTGNERFIQDYGFLDSDPDGFEMVAQQLLGKRRILEGASSGRTMTLADREKNIAALKVTSIEEDTSLLKTLESSSTKAAVEFRLGVKHALAKKIEIV